LNTYPMLS